MRKKKKKRIKRDGIPLKRINPSVEEVELTVIFWEKDQDLKREISNKNF